MYGFIVMSSPYHTLWSKNNDTMCIWITALICAIRLPHAKLWTFHMIGYLSLQYQNTCSIFWCSKIVIAIRIGIQRYKFVWFCLCLKRRQPIHEGNLIVHINAYTSIHCVKEIPNLKLSCSPSLPFQLVAYLDMSDLDLNTQHGYARTLVLYKIVGSWCRLLRWRRAHFDVLINWANITKWQHMEHSLHIHNIVQMCGWFFVFIFSIWCGPPLFYLYRKKCILVWIINSFGMNSMDIHEL